MSKNCALVVNGNINIDEEKDDGKKGKSWLFTSFEKEKPVFFAEKMRYLCFSPEITPTTNKHHWQGYMYLENDMTLSAIKKKINNVWFLKKANGSPMQNKIYCGFDDYKKDDKVKLKNPKFEEFGEIPQQGKRFDLIDIRDKIAKGVSVEKLTWDEPILYHQYGRTLEKLENIYLRTQFRNWETKVIWYWGKTSTGKSHTVYKDYKSDTHFNLNWNGGFWDGYKGQKTIIINETRGEVPFKELLKICDKWPHSVNIKGKEPVPLLCDKVVITSCKSPTDIYCHSLDEDDNIDQFLRRCEVIELTKKFV